jgi:hypothetical protein
MLNQNWMPGFGIHLRCCAALSEAMKTMAWCIRALLIVRDEQKRCWFVDFKDTSKHVGTLQCGKMRWGKNIHGTTIEMLYYLCFIIYKIY